MRKVAAVPLKVGHRDEEGGSAVTSCAPGRGGECVWGGSLTFPRLVCPQCWENGIILCRKMAEQYESYYDYRNLSKMRVRWRVRPSGWRPFATSCLSGAAPCSPRGGRPNRACRELSKVVFFFSETLFTQGKSRSLCVKLVISVGKVSPCSALSTALQAHGPRRAV